MQAQALEGAGYDVRAGLAAFEARRAPQAGVGWQLRPVCCVVGGTQSVPPFRQLLACSRAVEWQAPSDILASCRAG